jgi:hypothetical protein
VIKIFRIVGEELRKPHNSEDQIFWAVLGCVGHLVRWVIQHDLTNAGGYRSIVQFVSTDERQFDNDVFEQLCSIAQSKKLDGLKSMKMIL